MPTVTSVAPVPEGGVSLRRLGFANGPAGFNLPAGTVVTERVDQPNVVTLIISAPEAATIAAWLRVHLPSMGFTIQGDKGGSLVFADANYDGAFTYARGVTGLTLRLVER